MNEQKAYFKHNTICLWQAINHIAIVSKDQFAIQRKQNVNLLNAW